VDHGVDRRVAECFPDEFRVREFAFHQRTPLYVFAVTHAQVVQNNGAMAGMCHGPSRVTADVSGAPGQQDVHESNELTIRPNEDGRSGALGYIGTDMPEEFDKYSGDYESLVTDPVRTSFGGGSSDFFHARKMELLLRFFDRKGLRPSEMSWLDVGCGGGELLELGKPHFRKRSGCDPSAGMLSRAGANVEVRLQTSATTIPFDSKAFDLVTAVCVYHHVVPENRVALTSEIRRVLKPSGMFIMIEHNPLNPMTRFVVSRVPLDKDAQLLSARVARSVAVAAGLRPFQTDYFLYFPKSFYQKLGRMENVLGWLPLGGQYACYALNS
jgi:SAM-dependent methyltransferase